MYSTIKLDSCMYVQRDAHDFMRFSFYFWSFAEIADIYFLWFIGLKNASGPS